MVQIGRPKASKLDDWLEFVVIRRCAVSDGRRALNGEALKNRCDELELGREGGHVRTEKSDFAVLITIYSRNDKLFLVSYLMSHILFLCPGG